MNTETEVKLSKHISAAINAIRKEIDKKQNQVIKLSIKEREAQEQADVIREEISGLREQISKLKGE